MTDEEMSPQQQREEGLRTRLSSVQFSIGELTSRLAFADPLRAVTDAHGELRTLSSSLAAGRARGFVYQSDLEFSLADAAARADEALASARAEIDRAAASLRPRVDQLHDRAFDPSLASGLPDEGTLDWLEQQHGALDAAIDEAARRVAELARPFTDLVDEARQGVERMTFTLDLFASAGFHLQVDEAPLVALAASYRDPPGSDPQPGVLFLSGQRLRFEGREEKVLERKFLLFASRTETLKKLFIDEPIGAIQSTEATKEGVVFKDEILTVRWARGGKASFELGDGESAEAWATVIGYILSGEIEQTRIASASPALAPLVFPENCSNCGAPLPAPVKGQRVLACTFCKREHAGAQP